MMNGGQGSSENVKRRRDKMLRPFKGVFRSRSRETSPAQAPQTTSAPTTPDPAFRPENKKDSLDLKARSHATSDHWQLAYDKLSDTERDTLATLLQATSTQLQPAGRSRTGETLSQLIKITEVQYEEYQKRGIRFRKTAQKILNSALCFQDVISNVLRFDATGYASSAWAVVSLGLKMAENNAELRDSLFDSSEYLADILTRCAFIEKQFYSDIDPAIINPEKQQSLVRTYVVILQYAAELRRVQQFNKGRGLIESITAVTSRNLAELKSVVKQEEAHLQLWLILDQHLHREKEADTILARIDKLTATLDQVNKAVAMFSLPVAEGALFDSFTDQHERECLPGTRTGLLQQIEDWARSSDKCIFWLSGMAGTGKSTMARTVARIFDEEGKLGGSFFFKRNRGDRSTAAKLFPTIVRQLAVHIPSMIPGVQKSLENDPALPQRSLRQQFDKLILQPLLAVDQDTSATTTVIVIDALDECEREEDIEVILDLLPKVEIAVGARVRFFLTSRPESSIRFGFDQIDGKSYQNTLLQNLDDDVIKHDISLYLREEFTKISQRRHDLPPDWPGQERVATLTTMASPLFIFAATVCLFVGDRKFDPERRLQQFLNGSSGSKMDGTYRPILQQLIVEDEDDREQLLEEFQQVIGALILLADPLSLNALAELLKIPASDIGNRLDSFHSVLSIPDDPYQPIKIVHLSFHDYLVDDRTRVQEDTSRFWVDKKRKHGLIANQCLAVMESMLRKNICELPSYGTRRDEIDSISISSYIPEALQYACRYWVHHLLQGAGSAINLTQVCRCLQKHLLYWFEVMSILGSLSEAMDMVNALLHSQKNTPNNEITLLLSDANRFIMKNRQIFEIAPLQLYCAGLLFAPQKSLIKDLFVSDIPSCICRLPVVQNDWSPEIITLEGRESTDIAELFWRPDASVERIRFSPDGKLLASCYLHSTIKLWNMTGFPEQTLENDDTAPSDIAFLPGGGAIASASNNGSIDMWSCTGALQETLHLSVPKELTKAGSPRDSSVSDSESQHLTMWKGRGSPPAATALSMDASMVAIGCADNAIRLFSIDGTLLNTLQGHQKRVIAIAISPELSFIVSTSKDHTAKVWDQTGALTHTLAVQTGYLISVAISDDAALTAMGSDNGSIRLWQTQDWTPIATLNCDAEVLSLDFSPMATKLAAGLWDSTVRLWDVSTGERVAMLRGHSLAVTTVAFSPDGRLIASGSIDETIKIWDAAAVASGQSPDLIMDDIMDDMRVLKPSSNGKLVATTSSSGTVRLWETETGRLHKVLTDCPTKNINLVFSPDSTMLVPDAWRFPLPAIIWDTTTGALKHPVSSDPNIHETRFSPNSAIVFHRSEKRIDFRDTATNELLHSLRGEHYDFSRLAFSPCSKFVAIYVPSFDLYAMEQMFSSIEQCKTKIIDTRTGMLQSVLDNDQVDGLHFSADGNHVATVSGSTIYLWQIPTGRLQLCLEGHEDTIIAVGFSANGETLASSSKDKTLRLWDLKSGTMAHTFLIDKEHRASEIFEIPMRVMYWLTEELKFSADGKHLMTEQGYIDIEASKVEGRCVFIPKAVSLHGPLRQWIYINGENAIWIPHEYHNASEIDDHRVVLGHASGVPIFMEFCP